MGVVASCRKVPEQELLLAIGEGDLQHVKLLLLHRPKLVCSTVAHGALSPLHYAASLGQADVLQLLLENGAAVDALNHHKQTPLMLACKNGRVSCIERLLEWGANVLMFDASHERTCIHYAAKSGHLQCLQMILNAAQTPAVAETWGFARFINVRDGSGATPLHLAARSCHSTVVRLLLSNGALVCSTTTKTGRSNLALGSTPLHFAARGGSTECVKELLAWGADRLQRNSQGHTPFFIAMKYHHTSCAALLNPLSAEPLVWPSPWKFMRNLDPEAKMLLEAALIQANDAWEKKIFSASEGCHKLDASDIIDATPATIYEFEEDIEDENDLCCICFERVCTIEVQDCGHQMCAGCTLALCCHIKPNPTMQRSPAPACPFCRRDIEQLKRIQPKDSSQTEETQREDDKLTEAGKDDDKDMSKVTPVSRSRKPSDGGSSSSFIGLVSKGSFRLLSSARGSSRVIDIDVSKESSSEQDAT